MARGNNGNGDNDYELGESLDEDFPLGDGTADRDAVVECPYCGEEIEMTLDPGSGEHQEYVEDCEVCCQPWQVTVHYEADGSANVIVVPLAE